MKLVRSKKMVAFALGLLVLALGSLGYVLKRDRDAKASKEGQRLYQEALARYQAGEFTEGASLVENNMSTILAEPEGCELALSLFATAKRYEVLATTAQNCLENGRALGLGQEAYAFAMSELGRANEAISWLLTLKGKDDEFQRASIALARLYADEKNWVQARNYFVQAIRDSQIWSLWLGMLLKYDKPLVDDKDFIASLADIIATKPRHFANLESDVLRLAEELKVEPGVREKLKAHINATEPSE